MMKITTLIILFNSKIDDSKTIMSLLETDISGIDLNVIIWNNGPNPLCLEECQKYNMIFKNHNISLSIYEDRHNIALSKIYNVFVTKEKFDFISILDQDSTLNQDFFQNVYNHFDYDVIVPHIYSSGWRSKEYSLCFPVYAGSERLLDKPTFSMGEIISISSGLTISSRLVNYLKSIKSEIFNERYALYAIDTSFFLDLKELENNGFKGLCIGKIDHSLDFNLYDSKKISPTRKLEMLYSNVLNKIFYDKKNRFNIFLYLFRKFTRKEYSFLVFLKLVRCLINKKHPRAYIPITLTQLL